MKRLICSLGIGILIAMAGALHELVQVFAAPSVRPRPISHATHSARYHEHAHALCA